MDIVQDFNNILQLYKIKANCVDYQHIDGYFYYDLKLNANGKVNDIRRFSDEISLALQAQCRPSLKIIHQLGVIRLEFAGKRNNILTLFDYFVNQDIPFGEVNCLLGQTVDGHRVWMDLAQNPHMLIAGTTGSGKSTLLHNIIANVLNYNQAHLYLVDSKKIEFSGYDRLPNTKVFHTYDETIWLLDNMIQFMETRYDLIRSGQTITGLTPVIIIIDEFADLIMQDKNDQFHNMICRLAQKCRAAHIYIILSTQRPSVNIISGTIKANFPARIACRVTSHVDSKVILDTVGAENLKGGGDALIRDNSRYLERFQIAHTTPQQVCQHFDALIK